MHRRRKRGREANVGLSILERQTRRTRPRYRTVPKRLRVPLARIIDHNEEIKKSIILSFSACGNFLLSYRTYETSSRTTYFLQWWLFSTDVRLKKVTEVQLFSGLQSSSSSIADAFGPDGSHLCIRLVQAPDSSSIVVLGNASDQENAESRVNILTLIPVSCALQSTKRRPSAFTTLDLAFISYRPHNVIGASSIISTGEGGQYQLLLNTLTGLHTVLFKVCPTEEIARNELQKNADDDNSSNVVATKDSRSDDILDTGADNSLSTAMTSSVRERKGHAGCFTVGSAAWLVRTISSLHNSSEDGPILSNLENGTVKSQFTKKIGIQLISHATVDIERHLFHLVRQNSLKLASPESLSIHNFELQIISASSFKESDNRSVVSANSFEEVDSKSLRPTSDDPNAPAMRISCALVLILSLRISPLAKPRMSTKTFHIGVDWLHQKIRDLKMPKLNLPYLKKKYPDRSVMQVCTAFIKGRRLLNWNFKNDLEAVISSNAAVFRGVPAKLIRHPSQPIALVFGNPP